MCVISSSGSERLAGQEWRATERQRDVRPQYSVNGEYS